MIQNVGSEIALATTARKAGTSKFKRIAQMGGAAVLSAGLVGTFALPAYATESYAQGSADGYSEAAAASVQALSIGDDEGENLELGAIQAVSKTEEEPEPEPEPEAPVEEQAAPEPEPQQTVDVPSGEGAEGIVDAALAQAERNDSQDCTALVERSLRAAGIEVGSIGPSAGQLVGVGGTEVSLDSVAPGDILVWEGRHIAVYIGGGQAVHGGWSGNQTMVVNGISQPSVGGNPTAVVRF